MAEVDQAAATEIIGQHVAAFLMLHIEGISSSARGRATDLLDASVQWTESFMAPYLKAQDLERMTNITTVSVEGTGPLCAQAQRTIAGLATLDDARLTVNDGFHVSSPNLEHCHPNWTHTGAGLRNLVVDSCSHTDYYADVDNTGEITAASEIACKMLSAARVAQQLNTTSEFPDRDCKSINEYVVRKAEAMAAPSTLARYRAKGKGWCFLADVETLGDVGPLWVFKDALTLKENATCMAVASPRLKTALDGKIYPGNHYCKFLSPARVLDWMMTDSLKGSTR